MAIHKLTLSVDAEVVASAKRYAEAHDTSVSALVEHLLAAVVRVDAGGRSRAPITDRLIGAAAGVSLEDYRDHLERKYR